MFTLFCLVHGEPTTNAFPVKIARTDTVGDLKKLIKSEKENDFHNIDANKLRLWSVNIHVDNTSSLEELVLENNKDKGVQELLPVKRINRVFTDEPADEHIHVIIERPPSIGKQNEKIF
jgi:Crinkler effector protein N-terminal domain